MQNLVSVIIPTYNRAHLIGETLDSILAQTYHNWECIIVDDGSSDNSVSLINDFVKQDKRFRFFKRNYKKTKGANSCRNIGLEKADGDYIIFFDSDDLMTLNHIDIKLGALLNNDIDYVITRTKFYNSDLNYIDKYYQFDKYAITPYNYITQKINWLTYDICLKSSIAKNIKFNENLQSGQEYNYFSKLVSLSTNAIFIDEVVTLRRHSENSIRSSLKKEQSKLNFSYFNAHWFTYIDIKDTSNLEIRLFLLKICIKIIFEEKRILAENKFFFIKAVFKEFKFEGCYFLLMIILMKFLKKGYFFKNKIINGI